MPLNGLQLLLLARCFLFACLVWCVKSFVTINRQKKGTSYWGSRQTTTRRLSTNTAVISLLDFPLQSSTDFLLPLPTTTFSDELRTCSVHRATISLPLYKTIVEYAASTDQRLLGCCCCCEQTAGCVAEIIRWDNESGELIYRGKNLFRITEVQQTVPFRVASVEHVDFVSDNTANPAAVVSYNDNLLLQDMLDKLVQYAYTLVEDAENRTPLEESILDSNVADVLPSPKLAIASERAAIAEIIRSTPMPPETLPFLAVDLCQTRENNNEDRIQLIECPSASERIQLAHSIVSKASDVASTTGSAQELQVGPPQLPVWASNIQKGMEVEYFWNEEWEWCRGVVVEDPLFIVDEWILTVYFPDDESTHRLPVNADDKARWRPAFRR